MSQDKNDVWHNKKNLSIIWKIFLKLFMSISTFALGFTQINSTTENLVEKKNHEKNLYIGL